MDLGTAFWTLLSLFLTGLAYFAALVFVLGLLTKLWGYLRTPMPLPHTLTPGPTTEAGAVGRLFLDGFLFFGLFKNDPVLYFGSKIFHVALGAILFRHLRYFTYPVPQLINYMEPVALLFGYLFGAAVLFLLWRRLALPRNLYISNIPDYVALILLGAIAGTGILMKYWAHVYIVDVKAFTMGLLTLHPTAPPQHPLFLIHFTLVLALMMYFPFSKLLHAGGVFFSPSKHQPYRVQKAGERYVNQLER